MQLPTLIAPQDVRRAWVLWATLLIAVIALIAAGNRRTVAVFYRTAALAWLSGEDMYDESGHGFLYLPSCAVLYIPFALLPNDIGEMAWRAFTIGCYAAGVWRISRVASREAGVELFPWATIVALPLAWLSARNGQATLAMSAMMMLSAADLADGKHGRAACWLSLGLAFKPLILVQTLLAAALYRPMRWRLALGTALVLLLPLACQSPSYALEQYRECLTMFRIASRLGDDPTWAHLFTVGSVLGFDVPAPARTILRALAAIGTLTLAWRAQKTQSPPIAAITLFALAATYLMMFNPRTENNTYSCIAPAIGIFSAYWALAQRRYALAGSMIVVAVGILGSYELGKLLLPEAPGVWLAPLATSYFMVALVTLVVRGELVSFPTENETAPSPVVPGAVYASYRRLA